MNSVSPVRWNERPQNHATGVRLLVGARLALDAALISKSRAIEAFVAACDGLPPLVPPPYVTYHSDLRYPAV